LAKERLAAQTQAAETVVPRYVKWHEGMRCLTNHDVDKIATRVVFYSADVAGTTVPAYHED
jgi:hypothetical protein